MARIGLPSQPEMAWPLVSGALAESSPSSVAAYQCRPRGWSPALWFSYGNQYGNCRARPLRAPRRAVKSRFSLGSSCPIRDHVGLPTSQPPKIQS